MALKTFFLSITLVLTLCFSSVAQDSDLVNIPDSPACPEYWQTNDMSEHLLCNKSFPSDRVIQLFWWANGGYAHMVRILESDGEIKVIAKRPMYEHKMYLQAESTISLDHFETLWSLIDEKSFWDEPSTTDEIGVEGYTYVLDVKYGSLMHWMNRWSSNKIEKGLYRKLDELSNLILSQPAIRTTDYKIQ